MGWLGHGLYDGDGTQTKHFEFFYNAKIANDNDENNDIIVNDWMSVRRTKIPRELIPTFIKNQGLVIKKMKKLKRYPKYEDDVLSWQMLLALYLDNFIKPPKIVMDNGISATEWLLTEADDFACPSVRKAVFHRFIKKAKTMKFKY